MKEKLKKIANNCIGFVKENKYWSLFVLGSIINATILRFATLHDFFTLAPLLGDVSVVLLLGSFGFLIKRKHQAYYYGFLSVISAIVCIGNSIYHTYYNSFASVIFVSMIFSNYDTGGVNVLENIFSFSFLLYLWFPITIIVYGIKRKKKDDQEIKSFPKFKKLLITTGVTTLVFLTLLKPIDFGRFYSQWNREYLVTRFGLYLYQINDIVKSIEPKVSTLFGQDQAKVNFESYYKDVSGTQNYTNKYTGIFEGKNVIFIHAESIQTMAMETKFNGNAVTPNLNKLASSGLFFNNFYSQVSVGTSSDSEFTLLTSLMPVNTGTVFISYYDRKYVSIPQLLKDKGYTAVSMHANNGSFWNRNIMHKNLGYDKFYDKSTYDLEKEGVTTIGFGLSDKDFFSQSIPKLLETDAKDGPFMATMIMLSNHTPFSDLDKYGEFDVDMKVGGVSYPYMEGTKLGNYFKSAHYADEQIGNFINELDANGLLDNTVIVIYGDHDARLSKSDYNKLLNYDYQTNSIIDNDDPKYTPIDYYWYELNRNVPFIIWSKDGKAQAKVSKIMGMYDVMPTLGNMFGFYNKYQLGHDIFNIKDNIVVFPNGNFLTDKVYYNSSNNEYKVLKDGVDEKYIESKQKYTEDLLEVSDDAIVYDLIKKDLSNSKYEVEK